MIETIHSIQQGIAAVGVALLVILAAVWVTATAAPELTKAVKRLFGSMPAVGRVIFGAFVLCMVYMGATKSKVTMDHSGGVGLWDNGSIATNDTITARWTYSGIPGASKVFIDSRPYGSTNEWSNIGETVASALSWQKQTAYPATNDEYYVWWYYEAPQPVHTNGVWIGQAYRTKTGTGFITINSRIIDNGKVIATPEQKRKAAENE